MPISDATREQRTRARQQLDRWASQGLALARPVVLVPGWRDEKAECWTRMEAWFRAILTDFARDVHVIQFVAPGGTGDPPWEDFLDFGSDLADYVHAHLADDPRGLDVVAHSMGGLDTVAAIALMRDQPGITSTPLRGVRNVITFDTPFEGFAAAKNALLQKFVKAGRDDPWVMLQLGAMAPDSKRIAEVAAARGEFLANVQAFWPRGADNWDGVLEVPHDSAEYGGRDAFPAAVRARYQPYVVCPDTSHSGLANGVTNDLRAIVDTLRILTGAGA